MADFPDKVISKHAYVVLDADPEIVPTLERGSILFDRPYFPGIHGHETCNRKTGQVRWAYTTRWLFKVRPQHTQTDLNNAAARALEWLRRGGQR